MGSRETKLHLGKTTLWEGDVCDSPSISLQVLGLYILVFIIILPIAVVSSSHRI